MWTFLTSFSSLRVLIAHNLNICFSAGNLSKDVHTVLHKSLYYGIAQYCRISLNNFTTAYVHLAPQRGFTSVIPQHGEFVIVTWPLDIFARLAHRRSGFFLSIVKCSVGEYRWNTSTKLPSRLTVKVGDRVDYFFYALLHFLFLGLDKLWSAYLHLGIIVLFSSSVIGTG
jgi:hypothetical protein